ncbi:AraC-like DNA-binding protein [Spirosoma lacussanchae]|uniref:helix-turn-helix transcriptional regulator n=1 Tax=Spirosoma lacussanchae TaxID=1884249 RepID=UPI0011088644|nr:AraC family transcriptional regulator [Spirosoma lacussanchae]
MKPNTQHGLLDVQRFEASHWPLAGRAQRQFKLILIRAGYGYHCINGNQFPYRSGDIFFLGPVDNHSFLIDQPTSFCVLSFTELYLSRLSASGREAWPQLSEQSQLVSQPFAGSIVSNTTEQQHLSALVDMVQAEQLNHGHLLANPIVESLMKTIVSLIDRQLARHPMRLPTPKNAAPSLIRRMGAYICHHITQPDRLRIDKMADVFHYSQSHLSALFKQQAGESIQQYIIRYKLQLVEARLRLSNMTVSQIADEFGFTDICHLNKLFKQRYQTTPTSYRRRVQVSGLIDPTYAHDTFDAV